jgi:WD40 repeat protein
VGVDVNWNGELVAAAFEADSALVVDLEGRVRKVLGDAGSVDFIPSSRASRDGDYVLTTSRKEPESRSRTLVREWPVAQGNPATLAEGGPFQTAMYAPDGGRFITSSLRGPAQVRKVTRELLDCCESYGRGSFYAEFSHDGNHVVTAMLGGSAMLGPAPEAQLAAGEAEGPGAIGQHTAFVTMAVFDPDDRLVATASSDETIRISSIDSAGDGRVLSGHKGTVNSVAFSQDGKYLVSAADDGTARIWEVEGTGDPIVLRADGSEIRSAKFTPDGRRVITASNDGAVRVWRYQWKDLQQYLDDSTRICLTEQQRKDYLNEGPDLARARFEECVERERTAPAGHGQ